MVPPNAGVPPSILLLRQMPPVKSLTQHRLDHRLATDIQRLSFTIQLLEHRRCEIHVDSLHGWPDNRKLIREVRRHVLASIRPLGDLLSIQRLSDVLGIRSPSMFRGFP